MMMWKNSTWRDRLAWLICCVSFGASLKQLSACPEIVGCGIRAEIGSVFAPIDVGIGGKSPRENHPVAHIKDFNPVTVRDDLCRFDKRSSGFSRPDNPLAGCLPGGRATWRLGIGESAHLKHYATGHDIQSGRFAAVFPSDYGFEWMLRSGGFTKGNRLHRNPSTMIQPRRFNTGVQSGLILCSTCLNSPLILGKRSVYCFSTVAERCIHRTDNLSGL